MQMQVTSGAWWVGQHRPYGACVSAPKVRGADGPWRRRVIVALHWPTGRWELGLTLWPTSAPWEPHV